VHDRRAAVLDAPAGADASPPAESPAGTLDDLEALLAGPTSPLLSRAFNQARSGHTG
jgi:hypothetical protein